LRRLAMREQSPAPRVARRKEQAQSMMQERTMYKCEWYSCARCTKFNQMRAARLHNTPDHFQHIGMSMIHIHRMLHRTYQFIQRI